MKIIDVEGIGPIYAEKLSRNGIRSAEALLKRGASAKGRREISEKTGISDSMLLEWVNHVDLYRIKGVGSEYADLLEEAGVDSTLELAQRRADHLFQKMTSLNQEKKLVRKLPSMKQVQAWITQATRLPKVVTH